MSLIRVRKSSNDICSFLAASSAAFFSDLSTKPGGNACRYMHLSPEGRSEYGGDQSVSFSPPLG